jgi:hypothetical protein
LASEVEHVAEVVAIAKNVLADLCGAIVFALCQYLKANSQSYRWSKVHTRQASRTDKSNDWKTISHDLIVDEDCTADGRKASSVRL